MNSEVIASVLVDSKRPDISKAFDYLAPISGVRAGSLVEVPFGKRYCLGVVQSLKYASEVPRSSLKPIGRLLCQQAFPDTMWKLWTWVADFYHVGLPAAIAHGLPLSVWQGLHGPPDPPASLADLPLHHEEASTALAYEQRQVFEVLREATGEHLLHGITGSGKTELYFELAKCALARGQQVIYMLPEIALTQQMLARFYRRFPSSRVLVWHANQPKTSRRLAWQRAMSGEPVIVVGVRSAGFAPVPNPGLFVIDEEHDDSFKSSQAPTCDARIVAQVRARQCGALLLRGSATPDLVSYHTAHRRGRLHVLTRRYRDRNLPSIKIADMRQELNDGNRSVLSRSLRQHLEACMDQGQQAFLLLNQRGYSKYVFCRDCGSSCFCRHCSVPLVYHASKKELLCHHCNDRQNMPDKCLECGSPRLKSSGMGTQRLASIVAKDFPGAEVLRLDRDVASRRQGATEVWDRLACGHEGGQILVGTQMIAKGIDLPRLTLVGVVRAEAGLMIPDYNASERVFQLLSQVAGRAGRHQEAGQVVFQTYRPWEPSIDLASRHDWQGFYERELSLRRHYGYPPFRKLCRILLTSGNNETVEGEAEVLKNALEGYGLDILGPAPCPLERINDRYRWHLLLKADGWQVLGECVRKALGGSKLTSRISVDPHPVSLM